MSDNPLSRRNGDSYTLALSCFPVWMKMASSRPKSWKKATSGISLKVLRTTCKALTMRMSTFWSSMMVTLRKLGE